MNRPLKLKDKFWAVMIGLWGGLWIGLIIRLAFSETPVPFEILGYWMIGGAITGFILGILMQRIILIILFPFTFIGFPGG